MSIPTEFSAEFIAANSDPADQLYTAFHRAGEPFRSMMTNNPWLRPPDFTQPLPEGEGRYWETTVGRKHPYWSQYELPKPTKDIRLLRSDLREWGFCLIEDALSSEQCETFNRRLREQAEGERRAGIADRSASGQSINTLINKGECFALCIEHHPSAVQAGPLIEQLIDETLGKGWICHSFLAIGSDPGGYPQGLHIDQAPLLPWMTETAPALLNTMYVPEAVNEHNGGTLIIPGSHKLLMDAGTGGSVGKLPPAINLEAPAGSAMLFDGRVLHGTGVNRSDRQRFVGVTSSVKQWMRTQENWVISVAPEVLAKASAKLRHRLGLQALTYGATIEGFGLGAPGRVGDVWGDILPFRQALEDGNYERVLELGPECDLAAPAVPYTVKLAKNHLRAIREASKTNKRSD